MGGLGLATWLRRLRSRDEGRGIDPACRRELAETHIHAAQLLGHAVALRDHDTGAHNMRVAWMSSRLGETLNLDRAAMQSLMKGAFLHDVGKIGIPDAILLKPGPLTEEDRQVMNRHPELGLELIREIDWFADASPVVAHHHERWDGAGYPGRLAGEAIPMAARIFTVVDVFDALVSERPYKPPLPLATAVGFLEQGAAGQFDTAILEVFLPRAGGLFRELGDLGPAMAGPLLVAQRRRYFGV